MLLACQLSLLLVAALGLAWLAARLRLPPLLGMIAGGAVAAALPWQQLQLPGEGLDSVAAPLRLAVLALVMLRAGLALGPADLRAAGLLAVKLGSLPMLAEATAVAAAGHWVLGLSWPPALVLGFLITAISPAIVIPGLVELLPRYQGRARRVLAALLAGAPLDNVLALALLGGCLEIALGERGGWGAILGWLPLWLAASIAGGIAAGFWLGRELERASPRLAASPGAVALAWITALLLLFLLRVAGLPIVPGLVALGCTVRARSPLAAAPLSAGLARAWQPSQVLLFGLIGWAVDLGPLTRVGLLALVVLLAGQGARALGSLVSSAGESLTGRERLAAAAAYVPKATIQAAFAAVPLDRGLPEGGLVLGVGVLAVVIWAPLGVLSLMKGVPRLLARPGAPQRAERTS